MAQRRIKYYGPPGTGKTRQALELLSQELDHGVSPDRIAFLTFTRRARQEARTRLLQSDQPRSLPFVKTIHGICYGVLGLQRHKVLSPKDLVEFAKVASVDLTAAPFSAEPDWPGWMGPTNTEDDRLLQWYHMVRTAQIPREDWLSHYSGGRDAHYVSWFLDTYEGFKQAQGFLDFTDFLAEYVRAGAALPIDVMFVDEAQDLSALQWQVVEKMAAHARIIYTLGDDDQSIFTWAGANPEGFLSWKADQEIVLPRSWRLPRTIHACAAAIVHQIHHRKEKVFQPDDREGSVRFVQQIGSEIPKDGTVMVLYRNNFLVTRVKRELELLGLPYLGPGSPYEKPEDLQAVHTWEALRVGRVVPIESVADLVVHLAEEFRAEAKQGILRAAQHSTRYVSLKQLSATWGLPATLKPWRTVMPRIYGAEAVERLVETYGLDVLTQAPRVTLSTIHRVKGGEADTVVLMTDMGSQTYKEYERQPDNEHRVFYVGATRARERLVIHLGTTDKNYEMPEGV